MKKRFVSLLMVATLATSMAACGTTSDTSVESTTEATATTEVSEEQAYIEETLNLANNDEVTWRYDSEAGE